TQSRFVEQQHRRIGQKQKRKPKTLPRATRELASANTCDFAKAGEIEHRLASRWREAAQSPVEAEDFQTGEPWMKIRPLRQIRNHSLRLDPFANDVERIDSRRSSIWSD